MDPLDPLTEIVRSGQAFSSFIFLERLIWLFIGFFFIGAISTSITKGLREQGLFSKSFNFDMNKKENKENEQIAQDNKKILVKIRFLNND